MKPAENSVRRFFDLHRPGEPFVLPCAWDIASTKLLTAKGFPAIGTTSLGVAAANGVADEGRHTRSAMLALVSAIRSTRAADLVTCDIEDGFSDDPREVAATVVELNVQGINIEDSTRGQLCDPMVHASKITAIKYAVPDVFVNARVDTHWTGLVDERETRNRISRYVDAGADGIFVPGSLTLDAIERITRSCPLPVNVLADGRYTRTELARVGVARISSGSLLYRAALTAAITTAQCITNDSLGETTILGYDEIQNVSRGA